MNKSHLPQDRIVSFIDILGFKELIYRMNQEPDLYYRLGCILTDTDKILEKFCNSYIEDIKMPEGSIEGIEKSLFSDSIVISCPLLDKPGLSELLVLYATHYVALTLFGKGVFIRGGIAKGWCHHKGNILFGDGIINAYNLEKIATVPRIIISDEIINSLGKDCERLNFDIKRDLDGLWFIDFISNCYNNLKLWTDISSYNIMEDYSLLKAGGFEEWQIETENFALYRTMIECRKIILEGFNSSKNKDESVKSKYYWLAAQFNMSLEQIEKKYELKQINNIKIKY